MKYLLNFLFLFSIQSFSVEVDGKGIDCNVYLNKEKETTFTVAFKEMDIRIKTYIISC